jgi:hypothetical protein
MLPVLPPSMLPIAVLPLRIAFATECKLIVGGSRLPPFMLYHYLSSNDTAP